MIKYIIQIADSDNYPFDGIKQGCKSIQVRSTIYQSLQNYELIHKKIRILLSIKSDVNIGIIEIIEIKGKMFQINYQYVQQSVSRSSKMREISFILYFKDILTKFCKILSSKGIKQQIKFDNIGITQNGELKIFLGLQFDLISTVQEKNLDKQYQQMIDHLIQSNFPLRQTMKSPTDNTFLPDYSLKVNKKLSQLENRLSKVRKYSRNSQYQSNLSSKIQEKSIKNPMVDLFNTIKVKKNTVATGLTSNSFIIQKDKDLTKTHKLSFGDYETTSHRLDQSSSKESSLTKRINNALQKTEFAFKIYEKYSRKKSRKRS